MYYMYSRWRVALAWVALVVLSAIISFLTVEAMKLVIDVLPQMFG